MKSHPFYIDRMYKNSRCSYFTALLSWAGTDRSVKRSSNVFKPQKVENSGNSAIRHSQNCSQAFSTDAIYKLEYLSKKLLYIE